MITLGPSDSLSAVAGTATAVTCSIFGDTVAGSPAMDSFGQLYQGQLATSAATLIASVPNSQRLIKAILLSNTTGSSVSGIKFFSNGVAATNQLVTLTIPANGSATWTDSKGWTVYDATGAAIPGYVVLPSIANNTLLANISGSAAPAVSTSLSALIDSALSDVQGSLLYRGASNWAALPPGSSGQVLNSGGAGANPSWGTGGGGSSGAVVLGHASVRSGTDGVTYSITSTTPVALDATNLSVSFTVPASGSIGVRLEVLCNFSSGSSHLFFCLRTGGGVLVPNTTNMATAVSGTQASRISMNYYLTGLTPGASLTYQWGIFVDGNTANIFTGPTYGSADMMVTAYS